MSNSSSAETRTGAVRITGDAEGWLVLAGRILIAVLFLPDGLGKLFRFGGIVGMVAGKGLPAPQLLAGLVIALEVAASIAILAGVGTRVAAILLAIFTVLAAFLFHDFWASPANMALFQQVSFFKNMGLAGGLLVLAAAGPGRLSMAARRLGN